MTPGESLRLIRERKPLVHQITNYVVMNETANATLALGALPVMAHAREEVEEMVRLAGGIDVLGREGEPSLPIQWQEVVSARPEIVKSGMDPIVTGGTN